MTIRQLKTCHRKKLLQAKPKTQNAEPYWRSIRPCSAEALREGKVGQHSELTDRYTRLKPRRFCLRYILLFFLILLSCQRPPTQVSLSFYHWKSHFAPSDSEKQLLGQINPDVLFVRYFDIDWDNERAMPVPIGEVELRDINEVEAQVVPTIFITNRTMARLPLDKVPLLAERIVQRLNQKQAAAGLPLIRHLQLDCDWTQHTRTVFFALLEAVRAKFEEPFQLSATIRLHQLLDREKMGIPPIDRGMLMYYNMGNLEDWQEPHSILNLQKAQPYLRGLEDYPLPLDLALPIYSWGVIFRQQRFLRLVNDVRSSQLTDTSHFFKIAPNRYRVVKSTYLNGSYLYERDAIRVETVSADMALDALEQLRPYFSHKNVTLALYHLDSANIKSFNYAVLERLQQKLEQ